MKTKANTSYTLFFFHSHLTLKLEDDVIFVLNKGEAQTSINALITEKKLNTPIDNLEHLGIFHICSICC